MSRLSAREVKKIGTHVEGYPVYYIRTFENLSVCLCFDCAKDEEPEDRHVFDVEINFEDTEIYCDQCSKRILSAYGEDEED